MHSHVGDVAIATIITGAQGAQIFTAELSMVYRNLYVVQL